MANTAQAFSLGRLGNNTQDIDEQTDTPTSQRKQHVVDDLSRLESPLSRAIEGLICLVQDLGFRGYILSIDLVCDVHPRQQIFLASNYHWQQEYLAQGNYLSDPVLLSARQRPGIYRWHGHPNSISQTYGASRILQNAKEYGFVDGLSISRHLGCGGFGVLSATTDDSDSACLELCPTHKNELSDSFDRVLALVTKIRPDQTAQIRLSQKECEVAYWSAHGKSSQQIAALLNVADVTVRFHLSSIKNKLQTRNKAHSVAKAVALGLIQL